MSTILKWAFAFLLISSYLSGIDPSLEAAATTLGASWFQRFRRVILPLLAPGDEVRLTAPQQRVLVFAREEESP